jgi:hypothetical protein
MRLIVKQTECAGKMLWITRDTNHGWIYHGPFADEAAAHAFARAWKELLSATRMNREARKAAHAA